MLDARVRRLQGTNLEEGWIMYVAEPASAHPVKTDDAVATSTSSSQRPAAGSVNAPMRELLVWVARCPRTYADAMEAWQSSCPRFTVWEDALDSDLLRIERGGEGRIGEARVSLTARGEAVLTAR